MKMPKLKTSLGFTIIELMIATAALSTILVLVTVVITGVGNLYYKGVNQSRIQAGVRNVVDELSEQLQLAGSQPSTASRNINGFSVNAYCIGSKRYTYVVGSQLGSGRDTDGSNRINHVLWRDNISSSSGCSVADLTARDPSASTGGTNGAELTPPNSRLTAFCIGQLSGNNCSVNTTSPYSLSVGMAYGDADLLNMNGIDTTCKGGTGDQFCSSANLSTTVTRRL